MKLFTLFLVLIPSVLFTNAALAHPGGHTLICSAPAPAKVTSLKMHRSNGMGWYAPIVDITANGKTYNLRPTDEMQNYGTTVHDSPLGIIHAIFEMSENHVSAYFAVKGIPNTVQAFDTEGKPVKWDINSENDACSDSNGKAKFKGVFSGSVDSNDATDEMPAQIMDCELVYDSGMAC